MKAWNLLAFVSVAGLVVAACEGDEGETETSGAGAASANSSTAGPVTGSTVVTSSSTGGSTGAGICGSSLAIDNDVYDGCLTANCCDSFDPCLDDAACAACLQNPMGAGCDANPMFQAFQTCFSDFCPNSICGTELATGSPNLNACIETNCCTTFNACELDTACNACLQDPMGAGCDALTIFTDYTTCRDAACPPDICGTQIIFAITYDNMSQDTSYTSNLCAQDNCCMDLTACADPTMDGFLEMNDPEVQACLACLTNAAGCPGGAVEASATAFDACFTTNCP